MILSMIKITQFYLIQKLKNKIYLNNSRFNNSKIKIISKAIFNNNINHKLLNIQINYLFKINSNINHNNTFNHNSNL